MGAAAQNTVAVGPTVDHSTYLGGSDIAAVVGLGRFSTALDVWAEKTGRVKFSGNAKTRAGSAFERPILELYSQETGISLSYPGTLIDGWMGATPDALEGGSLVDVQVKMVGFSQAKHWGDPAMGPDGVPPELLAQVHWENELVYRRFGVRAPVARVVGQLGTEQRVYIIPIDLEFTGALLEQAERFWRNHVVTDRVPMVEDQTPSMDTIRAIYRGGDKNIERMPNDLVDIVRGYDRARTEETEAKATKEMLAAKICQRVGDLGGFALNGLRVTWFQQRGRIDWKDCAKALGATDEYAEQFRGENERVLRVTNKEG